MTPDDMEALTELPAGMEGRMDAFLRALVKAYLEQRRTPAPEGEAERKPVIWDGQDYINTIKAHRTEYGSSLAAARNAVDGGWRPSSHVVPAPGGEAWRTVPVEPTEAMIAAANALWGDGTGVNYVQLEPEDFYAAMLAASPVVPVGVRQRVLDELDQAWLHGQRRTSWRRDESADAILAALRPIDTEEQ
jgi:hypothetical protein